MNLLGQCLAEAERVGADSIAFPAIGTGILNYPPESVGKAFIEASAKFAEENPESSLETIKLVIFRRDNKTVRWSGDVLKIHVEFLTNS